MHTPDKKASPLTRRRFLATCSASAAGAIAFPAFVANLRGQNAPSRKLNIAGIGVGGQGASDLREFEGGGGGGAKTLWRCATWTGPMRRVPSRSTTKPGSLAICAKCWTK